MPDLGEQWNQKLTEAIERRPLCRDRSDRATAQQMIRVVRIYFPNNSFSTLYDYDVTNSLMIFLSERRIDRLQKIYRVSFAATTLLLMTWSLLNARYL
ncbi:unnamed protein product [Gongylonema pulchrum]|uniref:Uncharacterized protein n=1 Tax=Gongylonema pulchrum TaxID=637853 RepID=A0A3P7PUD4_9BILA|nr:unnamed protein product [Gongylonema pulchrum]